MAFQFIQLTPIQSAQKILSGVLIVDVRTIEEWNEGHFENAVHIPLSTLPEMSSSHPMLNQAKLDGREILIHCKTGPRAERACMFLSASGFPKLLWGAGFESIKNVLDSRSGS